MSKNKLSFKSENLLVDYISFKFQKLDNFTYPDATFRMQLDIGIKFGAEATQVREVVRSAVSDVAGVLSEPPPEALLIEFGESGLIFRVRWWVVTQTDFFVLANKINQAIIDALGDAGIEISFTSFNVINLQDGSAEAASLAMPGSTENLEVD